MTKILRYAIAVILIIISCSGNKYTTGDSLLVKGNYTEAIKEFRALTEADSSDFDAFVRLGDAYRGNNDYDLSIKSYTAAFRIKPGNKKVEERWRAANMEKGEHCMNAGQYAEAMKVYENVIQAFPGFSPVFGPLAASYEKVALLDKARSTYEKMQENTPDNNDIDKSLKRIESQTEKAKKIYLQALADYDNGMFYEAADRLKDAIELKRDYKDANYLKYMADGKHQLRRGKVVEMWKAIEAFGYAATLKPDNPEPRFLMAQAYEKKDRNDYNTPIELYQKLIADFPNTEYAEQSRTRIKELRDRKAKMEKFFKKKKKG